VTELDLLVIFGLVWPRFGQSNVSLSTRPDSNSKGVATVQIKELESPSLLPALEALDAEFGREDENWAAVQRKEGGASMNARFTPTQAEFPTPLRGASRAAEAIDPLFNDPAPIRPSLGRRVLRKAARVFVIFCVGVCSTLAWQAYGDAARATIARSSPQLGWLVPHPAPVVPTTSEAAAPASAASPELQQLAFGLAAIRQSVDLLTTQLTAGQQQMGSDIAKLRADEQEILRKLSATAPKPTSSAAHKATPVTASAPPPSSQQPR
jgi:hypothetical protein